MIVSEYAGFNDIGDEGGKKRSRKKTESTSPLAPNSSNYYEVPGLVAVRPEHKIPRTVVFAEDAAYMKDFAQRPMLETESVPEVSFKAATDLFSDERRIQLTPKGAVVLGPRVTGKETGLMFKPESTGMYSRRTDSTFAPITKKIDGEFAIMPDIRPEGEYELPSYATSIDGLGAGITRIPADAGFDILDEPTRPEGIIPVQEPIGRMGQLGITPIPTLPVSVPPVPAPTPSGAAAEKSGLDKLLEAAAGLIPKAIEAAGRAKELKAQLKGSKQFAPTPTQPVYVAPTQTQTGMSGTTIAILAGAGILAVGGIMFMVMKRR